MGSRRLFGEFVQLRRCVILSMAALLLPAKEILPQSALPKPITRDSADIRIIEYPTLGAMPHPVFASSFPNHQQLAKLPAAFRVDVRPYLDLGGLNDDPKQEFDRDGGMSVTELSDGTIVASNPTRMMMYAKDGRFLRTVGRDGDGPGEIRALIDICRTRGDTIFTIESARSSTWNAKGAHLRTVPTTHWYLQGSCTENGEIISTTVNAGSNDRSATSSVEYTISRYDGSLPRSLGKLPSRSLGKSRPMFVRSLPTTTLSAFGRDFELQFRNSASGRLVRIVRLSGGLVPITETTWRQQSEEVLATSSAPATSKAVSDDILRRLIGGMPKGESYAPFSEFLVDESSRIYVADYRNLRAWTVFGSDGMLMGRVNLPGASNKRSAIIAFRRDHMIAREFDDNGAVHVRFYRMAPITNR
jgi:hypothetical protein